MSEQYEKFKALLNEMFMFDRADLDFGIYRILNRKRKDIEEFLEHRMRDRVKHVLEKTNDKIAEYGINRNFSDLENNVYNHLGTFFARYYDKGDFISRRRYNRNGSYAIPYNGEEVKLHWANADQYYVKSDKYFHNYTFTTNDGYTVNFELRDADSEVNNNKERDEEKRKFVVPNLDADASDGIVALTGDKQLTVYFVFTTYDDTKKTLNGRITARILKAIMDCLPAHAATDWSLRLSRLASADSQKSVLAKHVDTYTSVNTYDFFIHKNLGQFLRRELDFYVKNEIMNLDGIDEESTVTVDTFLVQVRAVRAVGLDIISMLHQIEEFQRKLWLKRKFVVACDYCVTLDKIPESVRDTLYPVIAANRAQLTEWQRLFAVDEVADYNESRVSPQFLAANPRLVVDTKFFDQTFKDTLIGAFTDVDDACDGFLVHSENFQALNLLQSRYKEQIDIVCIDPPYNTQKKDFIYKDGFKTSSWISFMVDRASQTKFLTKTTSVFLSNIDEKQYSVYAQSLDYIFNNRNYIADFIWQNKKGGGNDSTFVAIEHEFILCYAYDKTSALPFFQNYDPSYLSRYKEQDETGRFYWDTFKRKSGKQYYPITCPDGSVLEYDELGNKISWLRSQQRFLSDLEIGDVKIEKKGNSWSVMFKQRLPDGKKPRSILSNLGTTSDGNDEMLDFFTYSAFPNPKPSKLVSELLGYQFNSKIILDYFAGSGTTGHAVINLNREDDGQRKYVLVEMGTYFDTVTKPRIQKVIYSDTWKNGKPESRSGSSHMFKYVRLESYEDTLNNLEVTGGTVARRIAEEPINSGLRADYMLTYMLDAETADSDVFMNDDAFQRPFSRRLNVATRSVGDTESLNVDMVETFNYLVGLRVKTVRTYADGRVRVVTGTTNTDGKRLAVIWRDLATISDAAMWQELMTHGALLKSLDEADIIFLNGDSTVEHAQIRGKLRLIDDEFKRLMFDARNVE